MKETRMKTEAVRWWPAVMVLLLTAVALVSIWAMPELPRQQRILRSGGTVMGAGLLLSVWLLCFSRIEMRRRLGILSLVCVCLVAVAGTFRIRGVSGDLVPILEVRWQGGRSVSDASSAERVRITNVANIASMADFAQFYGPSRNAVLNGPELETNWVKYPPKVLWRREVGAGWSGFAVKDGLAITQEQAGEQELAVCYEVLTGRKIWTHGETARYATTIAGEGPRATPTIENDRVYCFGSTGILNCLELRSGRVIWTVDTAKEQGAKVPDWGYASSPLLVNDQVIVNVGGKSGSLVSYSAVDGKMKWSGGKGDADYSSPLEATLLGVRQIVNFNAAGVSGHTLDGNTLWNHPWPGGHPHVTAPLLIETNQLLISSGYGTGSELIRVDNGSDGIWSVTREWKSMSLKSKFGPIFVKDNYIYGFDDGIFTCVALKTGQRMWKDGRYGHGQGLLVVGNILLTSERGEVLLIEPKPEKLVEISRFPVFNEKTWNPPALAGEYFLMRNDKEAACLQLATSRQPARNVAVSFAKWLSHR
jgi:outer membrane protein assembly factor BamB